MVRVRRDRRPIGAGTAVACTGAGLTAVDQPTTPQASIRPAELPDVMNLGDVIGRGSTRVTGLHVTYFTQQARHETVLTGEGV